jgi:endogenous inhibitor of DNA gyrase (YacG/DUF329 family)
VRSPACPTCQRPVRKDDPALARLFPFCSERCHLIDLGRWLGEEYRIPGDPTEAHARSPDDDAQ